MALKTSTILKFMEDELVSCVLGLSDGINAIGGDGGERSWHLGLCPDCHIQTHRQV